MKRFYKYITLSDYEAAKDTLPEIHIALVGGVVYINGQVQSDSGGSGGGGGSADLSNYYTKAETDALIPDVSGYTTMDAVEAKGYVTMSAVEGKGYVTMSDVESKGYTTMNAVEAKGYITSSSLSGYALSDTVYSKTDIDAKIGNVEQSLAAL